MSIESVMSRIAEIQGGRAIQDVIGAVELQAAGLSPLPGDAVHVELPAA
jgi:hypothetical protein